MASGLSPACWSGVVAESFTAWHMNKAWRRSSFTIKHSDPIAAARRSDAALAKASRKRTDDDFPVYSFTSLLADLATICANHNPIHRRHRGVHHAHHPPPHCSRAPSPYYAASPTARATCESAPHPGKTPAQRNDPSPKRGTTG